MATFTSICIPSTEADAKDREEEEEVDDGYGCGYGSLDSPNNHYSLAHLQSPSAFPSYLSSEDELEHSQVILTTQTSSSFLS